MSLPVRGEPVMARVLADLVSRLYGSPPNHLDEEGDAFGTYPLQKKTNSRSGGWSMSVLPLFVFLLADSDEEKSAFRWDATLPIPDTLFMQLQNRGRKASRFRGLLRLRSCNGHFTLPRPERSPEHAWQRNGFSASGSCVSVAWIQGRCLLLEDHVGSGLPPTFLHVFPDRRS